jgi:hypothetical protein
MSTPVSYSSESLTSSDHLICKKMYPSPVLLAHTTYKLMARKIKDEN